MPRDGLAGANGMDGQVAKVYMNDQTINQNARTFDALMRERRSIRGFQNRGVPPDVLRSVLETAQQAPSNCNVQPWVVHIVADDAADRMRAALYDHVAQGAQPSPDVELTGKYPGEYRTRQIGSAKALFAATGVERDDHEARRESMMRNFRFFDAPCAAFIFIPQWAGMREAADVGMYAQSLMLALTAHGLASCAQGALSHYAALVHDQLSVGPDMHLLFGIAFGYPDEDHPANAARTDRATVEEAIVIHR